MIFSIGCISRIDVLNKTKSTRFSSVVILRQVNVLERTKLTKRSAKILGPAIMAKVTNKKACREILLSGTRRVAASRTGTPPSSSSAVTRRRRTIAPSSHVSCFLFSFHFSSACNCNCNESLGNLLAHKNPNTFHSFPCPHNLTTFNTSATCLRRPAS